MSTPPRRGGSARRAASAPRRSSRRSRSRPLRWRPSGSAPQPPPDVGGIAPPCLAVRVGYGARAVRGRLEQGLERLGVGSDGRDRHARELLAHLLAVADGVVGAERDQPAVRRYLLDAA